MSPWWAPGLRARRARCACCSCGPTPVWSCSTPRRTAGDLRGRGGNTFDGAGAELFKIQDSDKFTFTGGSIKPGALTRGPKFERAAGHVFGPVTMPSGTTTFTLRGTSAVKTTLQVVHFEQLLAAAAAGRVMCGCARALGNTSPPVPH